MPRNRAGSHPGKTLREVLDDPAGLALLQYAPRHGRPVICAAKDECLERRREEDGSTGREIDSTTRIHIRKVPRRDKAGNATGVMRQVMYYHPTCFEFLLGDDLPRLVPHKLRLDGLGWGFMIRKWWRHRGAIDVTEIAGYIRDYRDLEEHARLSDSFCQSTSDVWHLSGHKTCVPGGWCVEPVPVSEGQSVL